MSTQEDMTCPQCGQQHESINCPETDSGAHCAVSLGSDSSPPDMTDDPEYQKWVESMAQYCHCRSGDVPCAGVLAGGLCDGIDDSADGWEYDDNEL